MRIQFQDIGALHGFLMGEELTGRKSRMRIKFCKLLEDRDMERAKDRDELLLELAKRDEEDNPIKKTLENGAQTYEFEDEAEAIRQVNELMSEDIVIDETEERRDIILTVKEIVLNTDSSFSGFKAVQYDRWCEAFEAVNYDSAYGSK